MPENEPIFAKFTPHVPGQFQRNVPTRDLTQKDIEGLAPLDRRDALGIHPGYGTPLYTLTPAGEAWMAGVVKAANEHDDKINGATKKADKPADDKGGAA